MLSETRGGFKSPDYGPRDGIRYGSGKKPAFIPRRFPWKEQ